MTSTTTERSDYFIVCDAAPHNGRKGHYELLIGDPDTACGVSVAIRRTIKSLIPFAGGCPVWRRYLYRTDGRTDVKLIDKGEQRPKQRRFMIEFHRSDDGYKPPALSYGATSALDLFSQIMELRCADRIAAFERYCVQWSRWEVIATVPEGASIDELDEACGKAWEAHEALD